MIRRVRAKGYSILLSSDHGMTTVTKQLNLDEVLGNFGGTLTYFTDSTMARFYEESQVRLHDIRTALDSLGVGQTYEFHELNKIGLAFGDRRFGDMIYVCGPGTVLVPSAFSVLPSNVRGMHGYDPATSTESGIVLSDIGTGQGVELTYDQLHSAIASWLEHSQGWGDDPLGTSKN